VRSQIVVKTKDVSTVPSIIIYTYLSQFNDLEFAKNVSVSRSLGSTFLLSTSQAVFQNELLDALRQQVPDPNPLMVLSAGTNRKAILSLPRTSLGGIVQGHSKALQSTFSIRIPFAGAAPLVSFFMP
jgi:hypothetical protein